MTLEQRIGRIDRIGQERETIDVINLFYADTAEYDAYRIMGNRMKAIEENVGPYRPIMQPNVERVIANAHRRGASAADIEKELEGITASVAMDLDLLNTEIENREPVIPKVTMAELTRILNTPGLMPAGWTSVSRRHKPLESHQPKRGTMDRDHRPRGPRLCSRSSRMVGPRKPVILKYMTPQNFTINL